MKILFLTNQIVAKPLIDWLISDVSEEVIEFNEKITSEHLQTIFPEFIISYNYRYIIKENVILPMKNRIINLHISYLPWNRGAHPNVWSVLENTRKGVTIHIIDHGIDTGEILVQKEIEFDIEKETLQTSYNLLHHEIQSLFKKNWGEIKTRKIQSKFQEQKGTIHYKKDLNDLKEKIGDFDWNIRLRDLKKQYHLYFK